MVELNRRVRTIDREFGRYIRERGGDRETIIAATLASFILSIGDICVDLLNCKEGRLWGDDDLEEILPLDREAWIETVRSSSLVGDGESETMLVLRGSRLYLYRYFSFERVVVNRLKGGVSSSLSLKSDTVELLRVMFATDQDFSNFGGDLQLAGALLPLMLPFVVLSGGPGTGKTTTVAKLLVTLLSENVETKIALAAPTGKAAQRVNDSIVASVKSFAENNWLTDSIASRLGSLKAKTIHRLLGSIHLSPSFRHNRENLLDYDIVVVDEASMIDLPLLARLFEALRADTKVILLGDQYQLASVGAGSILGDICMAYPENNFSKDFVRFHTTVADAKNVVSDSKELSPIIQFKRSFRFAPDGDIAVVSRLINAASSDNSNFTQLIERVERDGALVKIVDRVTTTSLKELFKPLIESNSAEEALSKITRAAILTVSNDGEYGQITINSTLIDSFKYESQDYLNNMPIIIQENRYDLELFNGDIGIVRFEDGQWVAAFEGDKSIRRFPVIILPTWQPAFAITIHKSQGSEYSRVVVIVGDRDTPTLTAELLYTAITRAKPTDSSQWAVKIVGERTLLKMAISRRVERVSGVVEELS